MKNISMEYAHIYTNDQINREHEISLEILGKLKKKLSEENKTFSLVIMVDDYSFPDPTFDYPRFSNWLKERGFEPDLIIRESQLIPVCDLVLERLENKEIKDKLLRYIKNKKYPCSLFIASWYLLRLGFLKSEVFPDNLVAEKLHNILPESFRPFEEEALKIIKNTDISGAEKRIGYSYFEGRKI